MAFAHRKPTKLPCITTSAHYQNQNSPTNFGEEAKILILIALTGMLFIPGCISSVETNKEDKLSNRELMEEIEGKQAEVNMLSKRLNYSYRRLSDVKKR